jgi:long-chain acyl-CoA synthetase
MSGDARTEPRGAVAYAPRSPAVASRHDTVLRRFLDRAHASPDRIALRALAAGGAPADETLTWGAWAERSRAFAAALVEHGVREGDAVAILAGNRPLWPVAEYGVLMAGAVSAGVFPTTTPAQVAEMLADCRPRVVVVDSASQLAKVLAALPHALEGVVVCEAARAADAAPPGARVVSWDAWLAAGRAALGCATTACALDARIADASPERIAGLIYTSGSTGEPKGACVSHAYYLASAESIRDALGLTESDTALSPLPYAHAAERVFGLHTRVVAGMEAGLVADPARLWDAARAYRPTLFGGLPRFYERLLDELRRVAATASGADARRWARLRELGAERSRLRRSGAAVPAALEGEWRSLRPLADVVLAHQLGGRVRVATSGGAPLAYDVAEALDAFGLTVLGAYGQTEHLCVAMHRPDDYAFDGVGAPMPGTEVRLAADGELLVRRNALTFSGYLNKPEATAAAFTPGGVWLRTGDTAEIDAAGRIRITGRQKEILALSTGKKVAPLPIERRLAEHAAVAHAVVVGDGRRHASALLFVRGDAPAGARATLGEHVAAVNASLAPHEQVRRWLALDAELTEAGGELTPTLKVRRATVASRFANLIEELYA